MRIIRVGGFMCEILRFYGIMTPRKLERIENAILGSFYRNNCSIGMVVDRTKIYKALDVKELHSWLALYSTGTHEILVHTRISTSGYTDTNTQPIETDNWLVMHNGVLTKPWGSDKESDTSKFADLLEKNNNIAPTLKKTEGSISALLLDKRDKKLYYLKTYDTEISIIFLKELNLYVMATNLEDTLRDMKDREVVSEIYYRDSGECQTIFTFPVEDDFIYLVNDSMFTKLEPFEQQWLGKSYKKDGPFYY